MLAQAAESIPIYKIILEMDAHTFQLVVVKLSIAPLTKHKPCFTTFTHSLDHLMWLDIDVTETSQQRKHTETYFEQACSSLNLTHLLLLSSIFHFAMWKIFGAKHLFSNQNSSIKATIRKNKSNQNKNWSQMRDHCREVMLIGSFNFNLVLKLEWPWYFPL